MSAVQTITRRKACTGKQQLTRSQAEATVARMVAGGTAEGAVGAYRCPFGKHWHVGHVPRRTGRPRKRGRQR